MDFLYKDVVYFFLVFARISGLFFFMPFFGSNTIPRKVRFGLALFTSFSIFGIVSKNELIFDNLSVYFFVSAIARELFIGIIMGYFVLLVFSVVQTAAQVYSMDMGFAMVNVFDPISQFQIPVLGQTKYLFMLATFFIFGIHRRILYLIIKSFEKFSLGSINYSPNVIGLFITESFSYYFMLSIKFALPILGFLFLINIVLGIMARIAPQMNVFFIGMPLKITVGFYALIIFVPYMFAFFRFLLETGLERLMEGFKGIIVG